MRGAGTAAVVVNRPKAATRVEVTAIARNLAVAVVVGVIARNLAVAVVVAVIVRALAATAAVAVTTDARHTAVSRAAPALEDAYARRAIRAPAGECGTAATPAPADE